MAHLAAAHVNLGKREAAMLRDCAIKFPHNGYSMHWAPKTMESLAVKGMVEKRLTGAYGLRYFATPAGKAWVSANSASAP
jgi:hypothetical protein